MARNSLLSLLFISSSAAASFKDRPTSANCTTEWFQNTVDHFTPTIPPENNGSLYWYQRVLICSQYWTNTDTGTIFFYTGNEGDVTLYANNTGLMWENAAQFNALLVFAEHRYWGQSWPLSNDSTTTLRHMEYLSSQQALADYAVLIRSIRSEPGKCGFTSLSPWLPFQCSIGSLCVINNRDSSNDSAVWPVRL